MNRLGNQLATGVRTYNAAAKELNKIDKDVLKLTGESEGIDAYKIEEDVKNID